MNYQKLLLGIFVVCLFCATVVSAQNTIDAVLVAAGDYERIDGISPCASDPNFIVGNTSDTASLKVGGNQYGCDSEWGTFAEFDFTSLSAEDVIVSATLVTRKTGAEGQGLYIGIFPYDYTGSPVSIPRADLNMDTGLSIIASSGYTNTSYEIDVTDHIVDLLADEIFYAGFIACGIDSEVGYHTVVYLGGATHQYPPQLVIELLSPVATEVTSWSSIKATFK